MYIKTGHADFQGFKLGMYLKDFWVHFKSNPKDALIVGSGTGDDVSAALNKGITNIDAVEIDPVIQKFGEYLHPDSPYNSPNVNVIIDDARSHIRNTNKKYDLMFISEFRKLDEKTINKVKKGYHSYTFANKSIHMSFKDVCSIYILNILNKYCNSNNKRLCVARTSLRKEKKNKISKVDEMSFFNEYLDNFFIEDTDSYILSEKSDVTICIASNLGPELLSRGKKVLFLNVNSLVNDWAFLPTEEGPFWYKGKNVEKIIEKIEYMLSLTPKEWQQVLEKSGIKMKYDPGNSRFKKLVNELCLKK